MNKILFALIVYIISNNSNLYSKVNEYKLIFPYLHATCFEIDKNNNKWIGTKLYGLIKFDGKDTIRYNSKNSILPDNINCLYLDDSGDIWIGTDQGLYVWDRKKNWRYYHTTNAGLPGINILSIIKDKSNYFWIGTNLGLAKFTESNKTIKVFNINNSGLQCNYINTLWIDRYDNLWIGAYTCGSNWYSLQRLVIDLNLGETIVYYNNIPNGILGVYSFSQDNYGDIWIAASHAIFVMKGTSFYTYYDYQNSLLKGSWIAKYKSILIDKNNNILIGVDNGIDKFDRINWEYMNNADMVGSILNLRQDFKGNILFIAEIDGELWVFNENGIDSLGLVADVNPSKQYNSTLILSPNPASAIISIQIDDIQIQSISIYNSLGIEIKRIDENELQGKSFINISTEDLPVGMYYCTLLSKGNRITKSFVVLR